MKKNDAHELFVNCINDHKEDFYRLAFSYVKNKEDALIQYKDFQIST